MAVLVCTQLRGLTGPAAVKFIVVLLVADGAGAGVMSNFSPANDAGQAADSIWYRPYTWLVVPVFHWKVIVLPVQRVRGVYVCPSPHCTRIFAMGDPLA